jgi:hypothetical protein
MRGRSTSRRASPAPSRSGDRGVANSIARTEAVESTKDDMSSLVGGGVVGRAEGGRSSVSNDVG